MMSENRTSKKRKYEDKFCPHCNEVVSHSTFYTHKRQFYYDGVWEKRDDDISESNAQQTEKETESEYRASYSTDQGDGGSIADWFADSGNNTNTQDNSAASNAITSLLNDEESRFIESDRDDNVTDSDSETDFEDSPELLEKDLDSEENVSNLCEFSPRLIIALKMFFINIFHLQTKFHLSKRAVYKIIEIMFGFFEVVSMILELDVLSNFLSQIPKTEFRIKRFLGIESDDFIQYVVCIKCNSTFKLDDCHYESITGQRRSKKCYQATAMYRNDQISRKCQESLLKKVKLSNRDTALRPRKTYCFKSVSSYLRDFVKRPRFNSDCELWRKKFEIGLQDGTLGSHLSSVHGGQIWRDFQSIDNEPFLSEKNNLGLMLNADWYNPFDRTRYSQGAIYITILNLPQEERIKAENVMLIGVIPGPKEPKLNINAFLQPLVDDLQLLIEGNYLEDNSTLGLSKYRAALLAVSSDIPATRKILGFYGHTAERGCSKCLKHFPQEGNAFGARRVYSGFDREDWEKRDGNEHKEIAQRTVLLKEKAAKLKLEKQHGIRFSVLNNLSYFDPVRMHLIDALHGLMVGTPKYVMKLWVELKILDDRKLKVIEQKIESFKLPSDLGRLPSKIASGFAGFTADQWKHFVNILSPYALHGVIEAQHYNIWSTFVRASRILCSKSLTLQQLDDADRCLQLFCKLFERQYESGKYCTPNMHLHLHLREMILDYGGIHENWCFVFERMNGMLGSYRTNNHDPTVQIMRRFQNDNFINQMRQTQTEIEMELNCDRKQADKDLERFLMPDELMELPCEFRLGFSEESDYNCSVDPVIAEKIMLPPRKDRFLTMQERAELARMFEELYNQPQNAFRIVFTSVSSRRAILNGRTISVQNQKKSARNASVYASWVTSNTSVDLTLDINRNCDQRPGVVLGIYYVTLIEGEIRYPHIVVEVGWLKEHPDKALFGANSPVQVWSVTHEQFSHCSFIPLQYIQGHAASLEERISLSPTRKETVTIVVTMP